MPTTNVQERAHAAGRFSVTGDKNDDFIGFEVPPGDVVVGCTLDILSSSSGGGARLDAQPSIGASGHVEVKVHWWFDFRGSVTYRVTLSTAVAGTTALEVRVPGFSPATSGYHFDNDFPVHSPLITFTLPNGQPEATLGDASNGLCGGMVYSVRDFFESGQAIPSQTTPPGSGPLYDYIVGRLKDSFSLPTGPLRYYELMDPLLPDHETVLSQRGLAPHGRAYRMVREEWPGIRADLDAGRLVCLGLIRVKSADPTLLGQNHQVLAFGYTLTGTQLSLHIYDPNYHHEDVLLSLDLADPNHTIPLIYSKGDQFFGFFRTQYSLKVPSLAAASFSGLAILFEHGGFNGRCKVIDSVDADLTATDGGLFNDMTSSLIIARGTWRFFRDVRLQNPYRHPDDTPIDLGPGFYPSVSAVGISNDDLSSLVCVG
jgi:hypothetical protein